MISQSSSTQQYEPRIKNPQKTPICRRLHPPLPPQFFPPHSYYPISSSNPSNRHFSQWYSCPRDMFKSSQIKSNKIKSSQHTHLKTTFFPSHRLLCYTDDFWILDVNHLICESVLFVTKAKETWYRQVFFFWSWT